MKNLYAVFTTALLLGSSAVYASNTPVAVTCTVKEASGMRAISVAEDGSFAGWGQPGCWIAFKNLTRGKRLTLLVSGDAGAVVRVLFNEKTVRSITLTKSGKQQLVIPVAGDHNAVGNYLLHFPKGIDGFYFFKVEK